MARQKRMLNVTEAARFMGVTRRTIYNWEDSGLLTRVPGQRMFARANLEKIKKEAAEAGVPVTYNMIRLHHDRTGVPDGRRKESIDA
jgi:DNA-binding transcriptional MerR regulator